MAQAQQSGLFGPGLDLVQQAIDEQSRQQAMEYTKMEPGAAPVYMAARAGQAIGKAVDTLSGYEDPTVARARLLDEAKQEVMSSGVDLFVDPRKYYSTAYTALNKRGLNDEAMQVRNILIAEESASSKAALERAQTAQAMNAANKDQIVSIGKGGAYNVSTGETIAPLAGAETDKAQSPIGKLRADHAKGLISTEQLNAGIRKLTNIPESGTARERDVSTGVDYFYNPGTGEWAQAKRGTNEATSLLGQGYFPSDKGSQGAIKPPEKYIARFPDGTQTTVLQGSPEFDAAVAAGARISKVGTGFSSSETAEEKRAKVTLYAPRDYTGELPAAMSVVRGSEEHNNLLANGFTEGKREPLPSRNVDTAASLKEWNDKTNNALTTLKTVQNAKVQLESSNFKTGMAPNVRTALGSIAEFFNRPEAARIIQSDATDSQTLSATFNDLVKGFAVSLGGGKLLSKELDLSREVAPNIGLTPKAIYLMLSIAEENMQFQAKYTSKANEILNSEEVKKEIDPVLKNQLLRTRFIEWVEANQPQLTRQRLDQFRAEFAKMEKAKDAVDINAYNISPAGADGTPRVRKFDLEQLNRNKGKFVMDKGVLYVLGGGEQYTKGEVVIDDQGREITVPADFVAPVLIPY